MKKNPVNLVGILREGTEGEIDEYVGNAEREAFFVRLEHARGAQQ